MRTPKLDGTALAAATALYRKGDLAGGDTLAAKAEEPGERAAFDWLALRLAPRADDKRLAAFVALHPHWPGAEWVRATEEAHLYVDHPAAAQVMARLAAPTRRSRQPASWRLARAALEAGRRDEAAAIIVPLWRQSDLEPGNEAATLNDFAPC